MNLVWSDFKGNWTLLSLHGASRLGIFDVNIDVDTHGRQVFLQEGLDVRQSHLRVANVDCLLIVVASSEHREFTSVDGFVGNAT